MIDIPSLLGSLDEKFANGLDTSKHDATIRLLCSTARRYNNIYTELERLKESTNHDKPFPILRLPREIRDEIYTYALCASDSVHVTSQSPCTLTAANPSKPPAPGLLHVNKQIYQEAIGILYSKNIFRFQEPEQLSAFEQQIGLENCERVNNICIWVEYPAKLQEDMWLSEYQCNPPHWIAALEACGLKHIMNLRIEGEMLLPHSAWLLSVSRALQEVIEKNLGRVADNVIPHLSLRGFRQEEREKFPKRWEVVMDPWIGAQEEVDELLHEFEELNEGCPRWF